jgi:ABC-type uncharacterized transport system substrate-binding protein
MSTGKRQVTSIASSKGDNFTLVINLKAAKALGLTVPLVGPRRRVIE